MNDKVQVSTHSSPPPLPFSEGVSKGGILQVSGQSSQDVGTGSFGEGVATQTTRVLENVRRVVEAAGGRFDDIISLRVFLTDRAHFAEMNATYASYMDQHVPSGILPARTTVFVGLPLPEMLVEIDAMAVLS